MVIFAEFSIASLVLFATSSIFAILFVGLKTSYECYYLKKSELHEAEVIDVLTSWNRKLADRGIKFSLVRRYFVIVINADFKKEKFIYPLICGEKLRRDDEESQNKSNKNKEKEENLQQTAQAETDPTVLIPTGQIEPQPARDTLGDPNLKKDHATLKYTYLSEVIRI